MGTIQAVLNQETLESNTAQLHYSSELGLRYRGTHSCFTTLKSHFPFFDLPHLASLQKQLTCIP